MYRALKNVNLDRVYQKGEIIESLPDGAYEGLFEKIEKKSKKVKGKKVETASIDRGEKR